MVYVDTHAKAINLGGIHPLNARTIQHVYRGLLLADRQWPTPDAVHPGRKQYSAGKPPSPGMCKLQATPRESTMSPKASTHPNASPSALSWETMTIRLSCLI